MRAQLGRLPGTVIDRLAELVQRSLVVAERGETTRYRLLVTVRLYGADRLAESKVAAATEIGLAAWVWSFTSLGAAEQPRRGPVFEDWWRMVERIGVGGSRLRRPRRAGRDFAPTLSSARSP